MRDLAAIALVVAAVVAAGCDGADQQPPTVVSGRTLVEGTPESAYIALYESAQPLDAFVQQQAFGEYTGETADGESDDNGRFTLGADVDEESAAHLILYAKCRGIGCSAPGGCVYRALPPLRRRDGRWVVRSSGRPLRVTLRIGVDRPDSPCY
jgi:hypothetical protein